MIAAATDNGLVHRSALVKGRLERHSIAMNGIKLWMAFPRFDRARDPYFDRIINVLPEKPGQAHALVWAIARNGRDPEFFEGMGVLALCGKYVRVRLPLGFNPDDPDACADCVESVRSK